MLNTVVSIPGYQIAAELYNGSRTIVYRAVREADSLGVVIKLLKNAYPSFGEIVQFRNQYTIAKNLNYPSIIQTYSLEAYQNGYAFVMEDFGGISLKDFARVEALGGICLEEFLKIAIALCDTLDILYHERIIHKDIKPANILINPETQQVKLIDFSIASLLPRETQTLISPNVLEGTLGYISPEQTGRMNRGIDYRTDFYSLGVSFYELLTGELPFTTPDAMELVHCHIAKTAPLADTINPKIPPVLSEIVHKLMAKNAENRYQSALGLKFDLEKCLIQLQETGKIESFPIAQRDVCDRFIIPDKLYGRESEVENLLQAFERVSHGTTEMMLVAGFSGIGKTAVVKEVHKPIVRQCGYFIKGKYDQFNRNIPFSAFVQAFRDLMRQLITESDAQIKSWKNKILAALGENGQVIIEVIPELERIIGHQPPATKLPGTAAQNRFNLLFQKFVQVFTTKEHPLVMFLDDLQWADSASLKLMELLMGESDGGYLLLIGAYRDNEVSAAHPLIFTLDEISKAQATINTITLAALSLSSLNQLVADTLSCSSEIAQPLTQLIYQKTRGNPFFSTQFIKALYEDGLIKFNWHEGNWQCDIAEVKALSLSDDVVEFMALQLQKLPETTQEILKFAACIGNSFDLVTLAIIWEKSATETATALWKALQEGLILPQSEVYKFYVGRESQDGVKGSEIVTYKFLHDRVQQAAYSLIPEEQKQYTHFRIGQLLLQGLSPQEQEERIFDLVNQLNMGKAVITTDEQKQELATLNLKAGQKAKLSAAYQAAQDYCTLGIALLSENTWHQNYTLMYSLHRDGSEATYLCSNFDQAEALYKEALTYAQTPLDQAIIYRVQMTQYQLQGRNAEAIAIQRQSLQLLGWTMPQAQEKIQASLDAEIATVQQFLEQHSIESMLAAPKMQDANIAEILRILQILFYAAWLDGQSTLALLALAKMTTLSLQYGNSDMSPFGYVGYGLIANGVLKDCATAYQFGEMAVQLCEQFDNADVRGMTNFLFAADVHSWSRPIREADQYYNNAYKYGMEAGNWLTVGFMMMQSGSDRLTYGKNLEDLYAIAQNHAAFMAHIKSLDNLDALIAGVIQPIRNLLGLTKTRFTFDDDSFSEAQYLQKYQNSPYNLAWLYSVKIRHAYLFDDQIAYPHLILQLSIIENTISSHAKVPSSVFYVALMHLALAKTASEYAVKQHHWQALIPLEEKLNLWAKACPENILHKSLLIQAEKARINQEKTEAIELYEQAITQAQANEYGYEEALANELAAKFYLDWGKPKVAAGYMQEAYYCYARWGAKAKTDDLEKRYPQLLQPILQQQKFGLNPLETIATIISTSTSSSSCTAKTSISDVLDLNSVFKAALAISSTLELDELIAQLTLIILENSGAKKSVIILPQENQWQVQAFTFIDHKSTSQTDIKTVLEPQPLDTCQHIPTSLINYVKNTQETVVINNCQTNIPGLLGEYMLQHQPHSVLCTPIINQGHLLGIIYLENKLTTGVFTNERLQVIKLLSSQAAISIENARLYQQAQQALQDLQQAQLQIVQSEKMSALGNLVAGVAHEMNNPLGFIAASLAQAKPTLNDIVNHLNLYQENFTEPGAEILNHAEDIDLEYSLEDLPKMMTSMMLACDRLKNISTSLRTFSRADKDYKVPFNIHEGIDSTILILKHRLKANEQRPAIEVITNYGNLPQVECFPGQLNQVFMNILANAIDALEEFNQGRKFTEITANPNLITITTSIVDKKVKIAIADNGKGMTTSVKDKIFDHLFTTKAVGKGTGLGLAIARQIVEETHGGKLKCESALGEGAEFIIELPV
ncbi:MULTISPECIES: ATP-binding sensor histidine kinase [unclassified Tolypothrix]|uniref:ATP-binding sensor histidine kinase n=1 Tax=unclassified Tolypothrix TaxID=2649714 RepID=UPI0005EAA72B|nr:MULTISPECIES: ATP-binding sensor histidine kinase [unclassified Tolypothrix]BAY92906.1 serine/threonine protein kinase with two-component sensor domain [Microchaete diplosiphon NIES-3275]EKF03007.1 ATPase, histidine kinase-, DNA gyrase B-, and HSP90-like domain protein [Tolypothrix sp. PCC 7601]MBE9082268.1 AAA family ATPase [Tolypothrix sp. LEGE 11397]UYD26810.1 AAA family ATPase [Tolypothrix sp. PCC 7712]UYD37333.1 AAA family ATPase [Tolypothrix sp. PCC 7601]